MTFVIFLYINSLIAKNNNKENSNMNNFIKTSLLITGFIAGTASAVVEKDLAYPKGEMTGMELAQQNFFVNHFYAFDNIGIARHGKRITALIMRPEGSKPLTMTLERYLNNDYKKSSGVNSKDLAIFRSGKLKGTGMLITDFVDQSKSQSYKIYIPSIRKVRRFAQPKSEDAWGGSDFTFGDVTLRKPKEETHKILSKTTMSGCLGIMKNVKRNKWTQKSNMKPDCSVKGKEVYKLKSTTKRAQWWYDSRVSYIDATTFVDYKTEYFKNDKLIKTIERSWTSANLSDPRANFWGYWYGKTLKTGHETLAFVPKNITRVNKKWKQKKLWSEKTLRKMPKRIR